MYYAHNLALEMSQSNYSSIVHDKMDKSKTSIPRLGKKTKDINNVMNLPISLIGMLTHGDNTGGFAHFHFSFLEMGSYFTMTSLCKCIRHLDEQIVDIYGDILYNSEGSKHPLHESLLQCQSYEKF